MKKRNRILIIVAVVIIILHVVLLDYSDLSWDNNKSSYIGILAMVFVGISAALDKSGKVQDLNDQNKSSA